MLARLGHRVDTVADGLSAVDAARLNDYDVVLMDRHLPALDGIGAIERIRALLPANRQPRIVAISGSGRTEDRTACADAGADAFLSKPLRLAELEAVLSASPAQPMDSRADGIRERLTELAGPVPSDDSALFSSAAAVVAPSSGVSDELDRRPHGTADRAAVASTRTASKAPQRTSGQRPGGLSASSSTGHASTSRPTG
jgi:CheY-like chemotaxis protein